MKQQHGVTLIELLVAMAIMAILVTTAVPSFTDALRNARMRTATNGLAIALRIARGEALKRGAPVAACMSDDLATCNGGSRGYIVFVDNGTMFVIDGADELLHVYERSESEPEVAAAPDHRVQFRPTGRATSAPTFVFCDGRGATSAHSVRLSRTGRIAGVGHLGTESCS